MKKLQIKNKVASAFLGMVLAGELAVLTDVAIVLCGHALSVPKFAALLLGWYLLVVLIPGFSWKRKGLTGGILAAVVGVPLLTAFLCWNAVSRSVVYMDVDDTKADLYADRRVMLMVPHQDDDINVLGGVLEEYVKYGSDVYVVFSTNGDYHGLGETRFREAVQVLGYMGIPEDHVIFLGYGDQWNPSGPHIYNAGHGETVTSVFGRTETYGTQSHPSYREGRTYTIDHFLEDIQSVILEYRPDVIYCVDYDYNIDHRALSLSVEKVMGNILKEEPSYRPQFFKGYAYNTAWEAEKDFYGENLASTQNIFEAPYDQTPEVYRWEDRVRFPVNGAALSRSVISSKANKALSMYRSQGANMYGVRVINSDKVFWQRDVNSLCYDAKIQTSSGDGSRLNDFMLLDSMDLRERGAQPYDGTWIPASEDSDKTAEILFSEPRDVSNIVLYDHPDKTCNVQNVRIRFDDGTEMKTGPLDPGGAATRISVNKAAVRSFSVTLLEMEGEGGLTEIEAFANSGTEKPEIVKIMDEAGNFAYDYWISKTGSQCFTVYSHGTELTDLCVSVNNPDCRAVWEGGQILVECPEGQMCQLTLADETGKALDKVILRNPSPGERSWKMFWLRAEEKVMELCDTRRLHERIFVCRLAAKAWELLG